MTISARTDKQDVLSLRLKCPKRETVHSPPSWKYTGLNLCHYTPLYNAMKKAVRKGLLHYKIFHYISRTVCLQKHGRASTDYCPLLSARRTVSVFQYQFSISYQYPCRQQSTQTRHTGPLCLHHSQKQLIWRFVSIPPNRGPADYSKEQNQSVRKNI